MMLPGRELMPVILAALARGQHVRLTANGGSMSPFIRNGDVVELEPIVMPPAPPEIVLAELSPGSYVLHRIVRVQGGHIWLRGDALTCEEGPLSPRALLGRAVSVVHGGRTRVLDQGRWHLAGLIWMRTCPIGGWLLRLGRFIRRQAFLIPFFHSRKSPRC